MPNTSKTITIKLPETLSVEGAENLRAYVVSGDGAVVETANFRGHMAQIAASAHALKATRLFVGPSFPADYPADKIDAYVLTQAGAHQLSTSGARNNEIAIQHLPPNIGVHPPIHYCNIQGNVTNTLTVNGFTQSGPVCKAKVHICTVDWYYRWPIWLRPVIPIAVINQLQETITARRAHPKTTAASGPRRLPAAVEDQILGATSETILEVISENSAIIYPYLCYYPIFWPWFYRLVEQEVVYTDCNGRFDAWLASLGVVQENIYIWVEASINGAWVTIYNPPFPCNTHWNYACGSEIDISLTNAAIPPCNCDSSVVDGTIWFTAIGNGGIALNIQQDVTSISLGIKNVGCTTFTDANQLAPFGATLNLYLASGPTLPATHYRWSWTYILDSAGNPMPKASNQITGALSRYYLWPQSNGSWESGSIPLQDTDDNNSVAYLLPNYDVTSYPGVSPLAEWVSFNFISAVLDSTKILSGYVIELSLELLNKTNGVFEVASVPVKTFQVSNSTDSSDGYDGSSPAPYTANGAGDNYLALDPAISGNALSFTLKVRVDNSKVTASINDAWLLTAGGQQVPGGNSGPCGFIQFTGDSQEVLLSFVASEPFNFATFSYGLTKGNSGGVLSASGYVFNSAAPFTLSGGTFSDTPTVAALLGSCPQAAFAETLTVSSLATDGSGLLATSVGYPYAAGYTAAFALTPTPV